MCMYSAENGMPSDWHLVHLGSRAVGGAGLVMVEATAIEPEGRISPGDTGIWSNEQANAFAPIARFMKDHGATTAIQLAHAGRKASCKVPWAGSGPLGASPLAWRTVAPSALAFDEGWHVPHELTVAEIASLVEKFVTATERSRTAGFDVVELHMAHGYLLHEFLSPISNHRKDEYGGSLENRMRFPLEVVRRVRAVWPASQPLFVRISATDWVEGGWDLESSVIFSNELKKLGVDLVDCSTGANVARAKMPIAPGYQVPFAREIRKRCGIATGAVGLITEAKQAESILEAGDADAVFMAREFLRNPYFALEAANELGVDVAWPKQYERGRPI